MNELTEPQKLIESRSLELGAMASKLLEKFSFYKDKGNQIKYEWFDEVYRVIEIADICEVWMEVGDIVTPYAVYQYIYDAGNSVTPPNRETDDNYTTYREPKQVLEAIAAFIVKDLIETCLPQPEYE